MIICRKDVLEEVDGFDESLSYGEDGDLARKIATLNPNSVSVDGVEYNSLVSSLSEVFRQGRWYGKSMPQYFRKHPEAFPSLLSIAFFTILPLTTAAAFLNQHILYMAALQYFAVLTYILEGLKRTKNPYMVFVPAVKIVRSYAEIIGMIEGFFTTDFGRE